jgi:hypothetical protein
MVPPEQFTLEGYMAVQSTHAIVDYILKYPSEAHRWHTDSNYIHQKVVPSLSRLEELAWKAEQKGIKVVRFYEPDIGGALTAIALEPSKESNKLTAKLPFLFAQNEQQLKVA